MTVPATARRAGPFSGNGVTTSFPFAFKVFGDEDLRVVVAGVDGVETVLVRGSDYSVTVNVDQDASPGGSITYPLTGDPLATGEVLTVVGAVEYSQELDLPTGGAFSPRALENALDRIVYQVQQLAEALGRSLTLPVSAANANTTLPAPQSSKLIGWDAGAQALQNYDAAALVTAQAFANWTPQSFTGDGTRTQFALAGAPGSLGNIDVAVGGVVQTATADYSLAGNVLTFTSAPANGVPIFVRYGSAAVQGVLGFVPQLFTATANQTDFVTTVAFTPGQGRVRVFIEGIRVTDFTEHAGNIVRLPPQPAGAEVLVEIGDDSSAKINDRVSVLEFAGVVGNGINDDLAGLRAALASGRALDWGDRTYRITDTLTVTTPQVWRSSGATLKLDRTGTFIKPALVFALGSEGSDIDGLRIDHNANGIAQPVLGNQVAFAWTSCVIVMADDVEISDYEVVNSWDSGISVGLFSVSGTGAAGSALSATQTTGKPERVSLLGGRSRNCGIGEHNAFGEVGKKGSGVNVLTGSRVLVAGHIDNGSYNGIIVDFAGGAQATLVDCICNVTKRDLANPSNGSGIAYYFADGPVNATNLKSYFAERYGFVVAGEIDSMTGSDLYAYASQEEGFILSGSAVNLTNLTADSCSQAGSNLFDAIKFDSAEGAISGVTLHNVRTRGTLHRWGMNLIGPNSIDAAVSFGRVQGVTGTFNANPASSHFLAVMGHQLGRWGIGCVDPVVEAEIVGDTTDFAAGVVGDSGGNGTFVISDRLNRNRRMAFGYDRTNAASVLQSVEAGVSVRPLLLNPSGGRVQVGLGTWNNPVLFGANRVWFEASSPFRLRFKNGSDPVSETDGTIVGTQS